MIDLKPVKTIHLAFCGGIFLFGLIVCFLNKDTFIFDFSLANPDVMLNTLSFVAVIFTVVAMNLGTFLFNKIIGQLDESSSSTIKFAKYQTAFLVKAAFLEAASLFSIILCLKTHNFYFIIVAAFSLIALFLMKPTKEKISSILHLSEADVL